jgi:hypothetical protein
MHGDFRISAAAAAGVVIHSGTNAVGLLDNQHSDAHCLA